MQPMTLETIIWEINFNSFFALLPGRRPNEAVTKFLVGNVGTGSHTPAYAQPFTRRNDVTQRPKVRAPLARLLGRSLYARRLSTDHHQTVQPQVRFGGLCLLKIHSFTKRG